MVYNREVILAWDFTEIEKIRREVTLLQKIRAVDHKAWQVPGFQLAKALTSTIIDMLKKWLKMGIIEPYYGLYQNPWYLVKKSTSR